MKKDSFDKDINFYKNTIRILEKKIIEKNSLEEKYKKENDSLKRQITYYKDKLKLDIIIPNKKTDNNNLLNLSNFNNSKNITPMKSKNNNYGLKTHRKNISTNFMNNLNINKRNDIYQLTHDNPNNRKRVCSMDINNIKNNKEENIYNFIPCSPEKEKSVMHSNSKLEKINSKISECNTKEKTKSIHKTDSIIKHKKNKNVRKNNFCLIYFLEYKTIKRNKLSG